MSRLPDYCECSKPNSPKRCRIDCGKPRYPTPQRNKLIVMDWNGELPEEVYERILKMFDSEDDNNA